MDGNAFNDNAFRNATLLGTQGQRLVAAGGALVGELLGLRRIHRQVVAAAVPKRPSAVAASCKKIG